MSTGPRKKALVRLVDLKSPPLPAKVRRDAGFYLNELQDGVVLGGPISKRIDTIGARAFELRFSDPSGE